MTILDFPSDLATRVRSMEWHLRANTQSFTSPLSRATQSVELPGIIWVGRLQMAPMRQDRWRSWSAWLSRLRGASGRFYFTPPHAALPALGAVAGIQTVVQQRTRMSLSSAGWPPSVRVLGAGDLFSLAFADGGSEMKILTLDVMSGADGSAILDFEPPLRRTVAPGTQVITTSPRAVMRLDDDDQGGLAMAAGAMASVTLSMVEAIP